MNRGIRKELALLAGIASAGCWLARKKGWARGLAVASAALNFFPTIGYTFRNRSVVITGSSRGLGLALAEQFLREGARVALIARDSDELDRAQNLLQQRVSGQVFTISCDVTQPVEVKRAFEQIEGVFGRIDILVNNAGSIVIGPLESMEREDFDRLLDLQVNAIVHATQTVLPIFRANGGGRVVNICSIGGKVAVPHMSVYCAAKFALAGLSAVMAAELAADHVIVTTVFPGMMRVGSPRQAMVKGDHEKEFAWFALGDVLPGLSVSAARAARTILSAIRAGDAQVIFPATARLAILAQNNFPEISAFVMRTAGRFFPKGQSFERKTGAESGEWLEQQSWYPFIQPRIEAAEEEGNQKSDGESRFNLDL
jgi:short-subunit dehydrogenase